MRLLNKIKNYIFVVFRVFFINIIASSVFVPHRIRYFIYKCYGINIKSINVNQNCYIKSNKLSIGKKTFINSECFFDNGANVEIGENCSIAMFVQFITSTHESGDSSKRAGQAINKPIKIGNGTWIGARSTILPGVSIGEGCIIAAGSLVTKDCVANGLYAGVPARRIKDLQGEEKIKQVI